MAGNNDLFNAMKKMEKRQKVIQAITQILAPTPPTLPLSHHGVIKFSLLL